MLNRNSPTPLHQQLEEIIKAKIENDEWQPDAQIPSENELSKTYGLSRMTTRNVIMRLVFQGLLYRVAGKGTFVAEPKITNKLLLQMGIQEQLDQMGIESETRLIEIRKIEAPVRIQRELALPEGSQVFNIERLRLVKGDPLSIHISYVR
ncbi:MAG: GntR family transcriptional regulator [Saccharofermentanales bacterium]